MVDPVSQVLTGVVARCAAKIRIAAYRHRLDSADLDDLIQEVRIRLWKALGTSEKIEAVASSYVYQTAASAAVDLIRRRRRAEPLDRIDAVADQLPAGDSVERESERADMAQSIEAAVGKLPDDRRVAVRMFLNGYNHVEIADMLGWTQGRARNLLYRGLGDMRGLLERPDAAASGGP